ncbi:3-oxoadipate enol-lactonase [Marinobacterium nitratireducens]|uniref:3-oxoadipate enol-lactonase n=1 Tax=Marinobacterium nitratireducens TaxID=518897 RepID=A0A917ZDI2_9GAMM|nr:alpha/beta fold hydrolase [Marinobacterium nitratireducens]GGO79939.1 3-oxoadipate enol-lactonase [Marinobacterium nitratireducens]
MAFLNHRGRTLCYRLLGDASRPLLILAHPLGMSQGVWDDMLPALLARFRVLTWDLAGHGASSAWPEDSATITPDDLAREALALADTAGADAFHFAGTSIGGVIGQQLIAEQGDRLLSATLTNTGAVIGTPDAWHLRAANVREKGLAVMAEDIVPRWFGARACEEQPALLDGWRVIMGRGDDNSYALLCEMLANTDFREKLDNRKVPLQLIGGANDVATPPESLAALAQCCNAADPVILEQVGHVPSVECPDRFAGLLIENLL